MNIGNYWNWRDANFTAASQDCALTANCVFYQALAKWQALFPLRAFDHVSFSGLTDYSDGNGDGDGGGDRDGSGGGAALTLTLDVSTSLPSAGTDPSVPPLVASQLTPSLTAAADTLTLALPGDVALTWPWSGC